MQTGVVQLKTILKGSKQYQVPASQGRYSWNEEEWSTFWSQVAFFVDQPESPQYTIGSITIQSLVGETGKVSHFTLTEGHQLFTTLMILIALLRDKARKNGQSAIVNNIENSLLLNSHHKTGDDHFKFLPAPVDCEAYKYLIKPGENETKPQSRLVKAYQWFEGINTYNNITVEKFINVITTILYLNKTTLNDKDTSKKDADLKKAEESPAPKAKKEPKVSTIAKTKAPVVKKVTSTLPPSLTTPALPPANGNTPNTSTIKKAINKPVATLPTPEIAELTTPVLSTTLNGRSNKKITPKINLPVRFTACTYNIWKDTYWPKRQPALRSFIKSFRPDVLCLQELQADSRTTLDNLLVATHQRVDDSFEGWSRESNIYWNKSLFDILRYGAEEIAIAGEFRRLFWVRLILKDDTTPATTLLVATAHFNSEANLNEVASGLNPRLEQARQTAIQLERLALKGERLLFMGDLNDSKRPVNILREAGLADCFSTLGMLTPVTYPAMPTPKALPAVIDWLMHRGALRVMNAQAVDFYTADIAPSDHKPVIATYEILR